MEHNEAIPYLRELVVFLVAAGIVVPVFHRLRVSPVLGFLMVGLAIGPFGLALFADTLPALAYVTIGDIDGVRLIAEFGVMFLLFTIGLELSLDRLWQLRRLVFGLGLGQILLTGTAIAGIAMLFGNAAPAAIVLGCCLALSSTAIVMQLLVETRRSATPMGRASFAMLLMQDLAVVPILLLLGFLAAAQPGADGNATLLPQLGETLLGAALAIGGIVLFGRYLLAPLYRLVGAAKSPELFMALTLLVVIAMAAATGIAGLSMALGAFLAGLLLAESEYRHAVEVSIEPFKGLLLGLFFLSVGMGIDLRVALDHAGWVLVSVIGLFVLKGGIIGLLALLFGQGRAVALEMALLLGQGGEFAFVVVGLAERLGLLQLDVAQFMLLVVSLSMALTPLTAQLGRRLAQAIGHRTATRDHGIAGRDDEDLEGHVLICGFGRVGQTVARVLDSENIPWAALDHDAMTVARERDAGRPVHYGDASHGELLGKLGAARAQVLVVTLDDPVAAGRLVSAARSAWPALPVLARARDIPHADQLRGLGASDVVAEAEEASLQLGAMALEQTGLPDEAVRQRMERIRTAAVKRAVRGGRPG
ncbi:MAG: cation:proton antiporter [Ferrovibrio sp.]|uniref:cation:proton antiporter domain-containing protein n=1 Tax=Ferrovibrio sp. TaxID=1917215 RepID=UPI0026150693|nr:cation:proton antiporter [Ferrovibrio sp.]MCW0234320.1 cation:proton antiporter [Ferrovibrio sp.]